jgi:type IV pilus assembly protein PilA
VGGPTADGRAAVFRRLAVRIAREEEGMTLVELLNVLFIMGILLSIAVPGYLSFKDRTNKAAAQANIRAVLPGIQAYGQDNSPGSSNDPNTVATDTGFENMTPDLLKVKYDPTLDVGQYYITPASLSPGTYCIYSWNGPWTASKDGPGNPIRVWLSSSFNPATCSG